MTTDAQQYTDDYNKTTADADAYNTYVADEASAQTAYDQQYKNLCDEMDNGDDPSVVLVGFIELICDYGLPEMDIGIECDSQAMVCQGDMTTLSNDIGNAPNNLDTSTSLTMDQWAGEMDSYLDLLDPAQEGTDTSAGHLQAALGESTSTDLHTYMLDSRQDIYIYNTSNPDDAKYNPTEVTDPDTASGAERTYYFSDEGQTWDATTGTVVPGVPADGGGADYIGDFGTLNYDLSQTGDPNQAQEALDDITNNMNSQVSTTQAGSNADQTLINTLQQQEQTWIAFTTDLSQSMLKVDSQSVSDQVTS